MQSYKTKLEVGSLLSDVLVDHQPAELDSHLAVKNQKIGLTSGEKKF